MNKLKKFFYGCLSRYSFHFFALQGIAITALTLLVFLVYVILARDVDILIPVGFSYITFFIPYPGMLLLIYLIYREVKIIIKEQKNPDFRIKNDKYSKNLFYGIFLFFACLYTLFVYFVWMYFAYVEYYFQKFNAFHYLFG